VTCLQSKWRRSEYLCMRHNQAGGANGNSPQFSVEIKCMEPLPSLRHTSRFNVCDIFALLLWVIGLFTFANVRKPIFLLSFLFLHVQRQTHCFEFSLKRNICVLIFCMLQTSLWNLKLQCLCMYRKLSRWIGTCELLRCSVACSPPPLPLEQKQSELFQTSSV
jgi:hypothetical protein